MSGMLVALSSACAGDGGVEVKPLMADSSASAGTMAPLTPANDHHTKPTSYETTSVTAFPDEALDHPFTYIMNQVIGREDQRMMLYTLIPHAADITYRLANEKLNGTTWDLYFQIVAAPEVDRGLYVHTMYQVPNRVDGKAVTDIKVHIMDAAGNVVDDAAADPPKKPKRPRHVRVGDRQDPDPNMPTEDPVLYVNGGVEDGSQFVCGFAYVYGSTNALTLTDDVAGNTVTVGMSPTAGTKDFIWFNHNVDAYGTNSVKCTFGDNDADPNTDPRWTICAP